jgi:hypothetical protein
MRALLKWSGCISASASIRISFCDILYLLTAFTIPGGPRKFMNIFIHELKCFCVQIKNDYEFSIMIQNIIFLISSDILNCYKIVPCDILN